nr:PREDICTED: ankyrin repeat domain-containing protein 40-like [Opisthocomus hoazin]
MAVTELEVVLVCLGLLVLVCFSHGADPARAEHVPKPRDERQKPESLSTLQDRSLWAELGASLDGSCPVPGASGVDQLLPDFFEESGVPMATENQVSAQTCLHWACKRNHAQVVSCLLGAGADPELLTAEGERAAQLTSKPGIRKILGGLISPAAPHQAVPLQTDHSPTGPAPAFQPFFFTGTFPYNMQELVLKVRVQNLRDNDFIEIELDRQELTYQDLLRVSCCELGVNPEQVEKIRKLPNTLVRKDKDVARLQDFQELELVLVKSDSSPFRNAASTLTERPCYNSRASKLTY